eukprot:TRINITY_DN34972_c0_g1_i1.p1 TRINITY_DN34972_c0_g1~~TRINITY_DN34972_c0_g1_i1.p1  ORF type:complete len:276 (+),score=58.12 TRINITY_DN34972_c0_g1_i1:45-872(+)
MEKKKEMHNPPLHREEECEQLLLFVLHTKKGSAVVRGPPYSGKSECIKWAVREAGVEWVRDGDRVQIEGGGVIVEQRCGSTKGDLVLELKRYTERELGDIAKEMLQKNAQNEQKLVTYVTTNLTHTSTVHTVRYLIHEALQEGCVGIPSDPPPASSTMESSLHLAVHMATFPAPSKKRKRVALSGSHAALHTPLPKIREAAKKLHCQNSFADLSLKLDAYGMGCAMALNTLEDKGLVTRHPQQLSYKQTGVLDAPQLAKELGVQELVPHGERQVD